MRRKAWAAVGALALIVSGCSHGEPGQGEDQLTPTPTKEEVFINEVHEAVPETKEVDDDSLVAHGEAVCDALEAGFTVDELGQIVASETNDPEVAGMLGRIGGIAVRVLCPDALQNGG